ncbi:TolC family protein [Persephonella sp.]
MAYIRGVFLLLFALSSLSYGERVTYEKLREIMLNNNFDIKLADLDLKIAKNTYRIEKSALYPSLSMNFYNEYIKDLRNAPSYIDGQYFFSNTGYISSFSIRANYLIYDGGRIKNRINMFYTGIQTAKINRNKLIKELSLKLLEIYYNALINQKKLELSKKIKKKYLAIYKLYKKLYTAGKISREELISSSIELSEIQLEIEKLRIERKRLIKEINSNVGYVLDNPYFESFKKIKPVKEVSYQLLPEVMLYNSKILEKEFQLKYEKSSFYPAVQSFGRYSFSSFDRASLSRSVVGLEPVNWGVGISAQFEIFDGYRRKYTVLKLQEELKKLKLERKKILNELRQEIGLISSEIKEKEQYINDIKNKIKKVQENLYSKKKLYMAGLKTRIDVLKQEIILLREKFNLYKEKQYYLYSVYKLKILGEKIVEHRTGSY